METFVIAGERDRQLAARAVLLAPEGCEVRLAHGTTARARRRAMWLLLEAIARQVESVDGKRTAAQWRAVLVAAWRPAQLLRGLDNTVVPYWSPQDDWSAADWDLWLGYVAAFAETHGVDFVS